MIQHFVLDKKDCWVCPVGDVKPAAKNLVVVFPGEKEMTQMLPDIVCGLQAAIAQGQCRPFILAGFESENWEQDFTPWEVPRLFKRSPPFTGEARQTLNFLEAALLPAALKKMGVDAWQDTHRMEFGIMGYSLGGLFALWSLCESPLFKSCAVCSGSLWYDNWPAYMASHPPPQESHIYLSLGKNEEHTRNPRMAVVGDITRQAVNLYEQSPYIAEVTLQWHEGGHFDDVPKRIEQALLWLAKP